MCGPLLSTIRQVLHVIPDGSTPCNIRGKRQNGKGGKHNDFRHVGANMADGREDYRNFTARVKAKSKSQGDNAGHGKGKKTKKSIESIVVQRVNTQPTGKLKKFEPLDSRDFVDFSNYDSLTLKNIKHACELFYGAPTGSCDVLYSDRGPSCTLHEHVIGKKVYLVRFMTSTGVPKLDGPNQHQNFEFNAEFNKKVSHSSTITFSMPSRSTFPKPKKHDGETSSATLIAKQPKAIVTKSVTIADLLGAGKLIQPEVYDDVTLQLESFDIKSKIWLKNNPLNFHIERKHFAAGGFRNAFTAVNNREIWVVKKFQEETWEKVKPLLGDTTVVEHTRKQVQMHMAARGILHRMEKKIEEKELFGSVFTYDEIHFSVINDVSVTVEPFLSGNFVKYVNNNGVPGTSASAKKDAYQKAEAVCHFSLADSEGKLLLLDLHIT